MNEIMSKPASVDVRVISEVETIPLRQEVLRPRRPVAASRFPGDNAPESRHFGAFRDGRLLCIASIFLVEMPDFPGVPAFQLRGMATSPEARNSGLGRAVVRGCEAFARERKAKILWCNARTGAVGFYRKLGFEIVGDEFEIHDVGPHFRMLLKTA